MTPPDAPDPIPEPREPGCAVVEHGGEGAEGMPENEANDRESEDKQDARASK